jgi:hypothetical protein
MYLSDRWLASFDEAYAPRAVTRAAPSPTSSSTHRGSGSLGSPRIGKTASLVVPKGGSKGEHPIVQQVDKIHGYLSKTNLVPLCHSTGFSRSQLLAFWLQYKSLCALSSSPLGVDLPSFRKFVPSVTLEDDLFVTRVFAVLDRTGSALISWSDFLEAMSCLGMGERKKRAAFIFRVYDKSGQGNLSALDLFHFFAASLNVPVPPGFDPAAEAAAAEQGLEPGGSPLENLRGASAKLYACYTFSQMAFLVLDPQGKGFVTLESVLEYLSEGRNPEAKNVGAVFGRSMLNSIESDTKDIMSGAHKSKLDAAAGEKMTLIKAHKLLLEESLHVGET